MSVQLKPREGAKDETVAYTVHILFFLNVRLYRLISSFVQKAAFRFSLCDVVGVERVAWKPAVVDGCNE